ncbi:hypothetical protein N9Y17_03300 [Gammaproteobacteria bacterium]|nr:hypothetical protein [Gammaproteobacteria bacterium]
MAADVQSHIDAKVLQAIQIGKTFTDSQALKNFLTQAASNKDDAITAQQVEVALENEKIESLLQTLNNEQLSGQAKLNTIAAGSLVFSEAEAQEDQPSALQSAAQKQKYDAEALKPRNAELDNLEQNDIRQNADGALQIQTDQYGKVADNRRMGQKLFDKIYKEGGLINLNKKVDYTPGTTTNPVGWKSTHHETSKGFHENTLRAGVPCPMYNSKEKPSSAVTLMRDFMEARDEKIKELYQNHLTANQDKQGSSLTVNNTIQNDHLDVENDAQVPSITTTNRNLLSPQEWHNVNLETFKQQIPLDGDEKLSNQQIKDMTATYIKTLTPEHVVKLAEEIALYPEQEVVKEMTRPKRDPSSGTMTNETYNVIVKERTDMPKHLQYIEDALFTPDVAINPSARAVIKDGKVEAKEHASGWNQKIQNLIGNRNTSNDKEQIAQLVDGVCKEYKIEPNSIHHKGDQDQQEDLQSSQKAEIDSESQKLDLPTTLLETFVRNNTTPFKNEGSQADEIVLKEPSEPSNPRQEAIISDPEQNNQSLNMNQQ